jgi:hypothetical protein
MFLVSSTLPSLNCYIVRSPEIDKGVPLLNKQMENVLPGETSIVAAKRGVHSTIASRGELIQRESQTY